MNAPGAAAVGLSADKFEEAGFMRELVHLKDTQESIQGLSAWCLRHRKSAFKIGRCWLKVVKKVKVEQRLPLFYLVNDIVQHAKKRNVQELLAKLGPVIREAVPHAQATPIQDRVRRVIRIWQEREIYEASFLRELLQSLDPTAEVPEADLDLVDNFQPTQLCTQLKIMKALEDDTDYKLRTLQESEVNIIDIEPLREKLKDRQHGNDLINDFEDGRKRMEQYIKALDREINKRRQVVELLSHGKKYYESLLGEADIVATAYANFGKRLENVKHKLIQDKIPELSQTEDLVSISPVPSPDYDAPSPEADEMELELPDDDDPSSHIAINQPADGLHPSAGGGAAQNSDLNSRLDSFRSNIQGNNSGSLATTSSFTRPPRLTPSAGPPQPVKKPASSEYSISEFLTKLASGEAVDVEKFTGGSKLTAKPPAPTLIQSSAIRPPPGPPPATEGHHHPPDFWSNFSEPPPRGSHGSHEGRGDAGDFPPHASSDEMSWREEEDPIPEWQMEPEEDSPPEEVHYNNLALARMAAKKDANLISLTTESSNGGPPKSIHPMDQPPPPFRSAPNVYKPSANLSIPPPPPPHVQNNGQNGAPPSGGGPTPRPSLQDRLKSLAGVPFDTPSAMDDGGGPPPPNWNQSEGFNQRPPFHPQGGGANSHNYDHSGEEKPFKMEINKTRGGMSNRNHHEFHDYPQPGPPGPHAHPPRGRGGYRGYPRPPRGGNQYHRGGQW